MKIISLENISRKFGEKAALQNVSFSMEQGDFLILFGPDGAGKTSLLHILMGFDRDYEGRAQVLGMVPADWGREERSIIRFVPDSIVQEDMTGEAYLAVAAEKTKRYDRKLEKELCGRLQLPIESHLLAMEPQENKLIQIVAAVCAKPMLLILDEPGNFLDRKSSSLFLKLLTMWNQAGMSIFLAVKNYRHGEGKGTHYAYLAEGKLMKWDHVNPRDYRKKAVTFRGLKEGAEEKFLQDRVGNCIGKHSGEITYLYEGSMEELPLLLSRAGARDFIVEELSLEEEICQDYSRWR